LTVSRRIQAFTAPRKRRDRSRDQLAAGHGRDRAAALSSEGVRYPELGRSGLGLDPIPWTPD
jgi:hypothetical protein